jgi:hypothetical protein
MIIRHNLLCKAWADRPGVYMDILYIKCKKIKTKNIYKETQNVHMYISPDTDTDCDLLHDRPVLWTGRSPRDKQNCNCLDYIQSLVTSPGGARRQAAWLSRRQL